MFIELYYTYGLHPITKVILTKSEYGNHRLHHNAINIDTKQFYFAAHPFTTGQNVKYYWTLSCCEQK